MSDDRAVPRPHQRAGIATAEAGVVLLDGPDGFAVTLTARAAAETGQSLIEAAAIADRQVALPDEDRPAGLRD